MLIRPMPLPDELDRGYLGRVGRMNGVRDDKQCVALIAAWVGLDGRSGTEVSRLELLRQVAGITLEAFACRHTTLPFRRGITSYHADLPHGDASSQGILWASGMRTARRGAYFCEACVAADQDFHGVSYWRREHQIPGMLRCDKHNAALCYVDDEWAFYEAPAAFIGNCHAISGEWAAETIDNPAVQRYLDICSSLLEQPKPFDVRDVGRILAERARRRGLQTWGAPGKRLASAPLLSDLVVDTFSSSWLTQVLPELANKPRGILLNRMDGVLYLSTSASSVVAYALAASVLFESADEALQAFQLSHANVSPPRDTRTFRRIENEALRSAYFAARGAHAATGRSLNASMAAVSSRLDAIGLPNLHARGERNPVEALRAFLVEGRSFEASAARGRLSQSAFESCLRTAAVHLFELFAQDEPKVTPTKRAGRRTRQLAPHEVLRMNQTDPVGAT